MRVPKMEFMKKENLCNCVPCCQIYYSAIRKIKGLFLVPSDFKMYVVSGFSFSCFTAFVLFSSASRVQKHIELQIYQGLQCPNAYMHLLWKPRNHSVSLKTSLQCILCWWIDTIPCCITYHPIQGTKSTVNCQTAEFHLKSIWQNANPRYKQRKNTNTIL